MKRVLKPTKEVLEDMYLVKNMDTVKIGKIVGVAYVTIIRWLKEYKVPLRSFSESKLKGKIKPTKKVIGEMYLVKKMNPAEIGYIVGVSDTTIRKWLILYNIPIRNGSEVQLKGVVKPSKFNLEKMYLKDMLTANEIAEKLGVYSGTIGRWLRLYKIPVRTLSETQLNGIVKPSKNVLENLYLNELVSTTQIGKTFGVGHSTILNWLKEYNIKSRTLSEAQINADLTGEKSPHWRGGISFLPYCEKFNNRLKELIRNRDNRTCQNCGIKENGKKHSIHHIHYDKENCFPDLITVCHSCNSKANSNRDEWESLYMNKLNNRGLLHWILLNTNQNSNISQGDQ